MNACARRCGPGHRPWTWALALSALGLVSAAVGAADMASAARDASIAGIEAAYAEHQYGVSELARFYVARWEELDRILFTGRCLKYLIFNSLL